MRLVDRAVRIAGDREIEGDDLDPIGAEIDRAGAVGDGETIFIEVQRPVMRLSATA